jgi:hypothetical protein
MADCRRKQFLGKDPCRVLTDAEKQELCSMNPNWKKHPTVTDINIQVRHPSVPIVDSFRIFRGFVADERVSQKIVMILVPDDAEKPFCREIYRPAPKILPVRQA